MKQTVAKLGPLGYQAGDIADGPQQVKPGRAGREQDLHEDTGRAGHELIPVLKGSGRWNAQSGKRAIGPKLGAIGLHSYGRNAQCFSFGGELSWLLGGAEGAKPLADKLVGGSSVP